MLSGLKFKHPWILLEFIILCLAVPGYIIATKAAAYMFVFLWAAALYSLVILLKFYKMRLQDIWRWNQVTWVHLRPILMRFLICTIGMLAICFWLLPDRFLMLPREHPEFVLILCCLYPLISALPQELVFCSFFFKRYGVFFGNSLRMVIASAIIFAYAHVLYINWVAPSLGIIAGLIFADTFRKHRSLALVTIEHGLYGNALFVIGLGWYFYSGAVAG